MFLWKKLSIKFLFRNKAFYNKDLTSKSFDVCHFIRGWFLDNCFLGNMTTLFLFCKYWYFSLTCFILPIMLGFVCEKSWIFFDDFFMTIKNFHLFLYLFTSVKLIICCFFFFFFSFLMLFNHFCLFFLMILLE